MALRTAAQASPTGDTMPSTRAPACEYASARGSVIDGSYSLAQVMKKPGREPASSISSASSEAYSHISSGFSTGRVLCSWRTTISQPPFLISARHCGSEYRSWSVYPPTAYISVPGAAPGSADSQNAA